MPAIELAATPFSYELPADRIAQRPIEPPDTAKLLCVDRCSGQISESVFANLHTLLRPDDILVFNNTRVIPARLLGNLADSGGVVELLLIHRLVNDKWRCMGKPLKKLNNGTQINFGAELVATVEERVSDREVIVEFRSLGNKSASLLLQALGSMPIPPYIRAGKSDEQDVIDYQTMFAEVEGAIAAPTASLHFTPELINRLLAMGCALEFITLHVGPASFLTLWDEDKNSSSLVPPPAESCIFTSDVIDRLLAARSVGRRVIAVGTTVVRALESMLKARENGSEAQFSQADVFITPGYKFGLIDGLITNFHQPRTTHLLLVEALMGEELLKRSYDQALSSNFRFLSYGDGMLIGAASLRGCP